MIQLKELTPVEEYNNILFKRDDLYAPYGKDFVTGGKIRQCRDLVITNLKHIKEECNNTIATASSIHSPQAVIVSKIAEEFKLKSIIGIGNTTVKKAMKIKPMRLCAELGSEIIILSKSQGFNNVLYPNLDKLSKIRPLFKILFGYATAAKYKSSIIDRIAEQVKNVDCDTLYVPVGSGTTLTGILEGVKRYNKKCKVIGLQPFGYDRTKTINEKLQGMVWEYSYDFKISKYPYQKLLKKNIGFDLDMIYESKSFEMMEKIMNKKEKSCFWVIGNTNYIRD
jgi:1-aminocyclopropane-1-carboxylate deaminase/D-cysteine desulfhydrase-like pyridoxal-dependent ACC family enzyme